MSCWGSTNEEHDSNQSPLKIMPFKIGFEFQESSGLCPWAKDDNNIQKQILFSIKSIKNDQKLWHLVIDTNDIEFVTRPFSNDEETDLQQCIDSIISNFDILKKILIEQKQVTFDSWLLLVEQNLSDSNCYLRKKDRYKFVQDQNITLPDNHENFRYAPQVTIQHPLEYTIPLYYSLFGFESSHMLQFNSSLPLKNTFSNYINNCNYRAIQQLAIGYQKKLNGLVFLHALTLVCMTPTDDEDGEALQETEDNLLNYAQVDPKMKLPLMSRRPFSNMFKDLKSDKDYATYFQEVMLDNDGFQDFFEVPKLFNKTNYAEQFFEESGKILDLSFFKNFLTDDFKALFGNAVDRLLSQGIISTTLLRNVKDDFKLNEKSSIQNLFDHYYQLAVTSVASPKHFYRININNNMNTEDLAKDQNQLLQEIDSLYDVLSPPIFLDLKNSMGYFKNDDKIDKDYGEAVIEVRGISNVKEWFLRKCQLDEKLSGIFLKDPGKDLSNQALKLFKFLHNFNNKDNYEDILFGMTHAVKNTKL